MMKPILALLLFLITSCQEPTLTESEKVAAADSARAVLKTVFDYANKLEYKSALDFYSGDPDAKYIDNGSIHPSLEAMKEAYDQAGATMELIDNKVASWDAVVLTKDARRLHIAD